MQRHTGLFLIKPFTLKMGRHRDNILSSTVTMYGDRQTQKSRNKQDHTRVTFDGINNRLLSGKQKDDPAQEERDHALIHKQKETTGEI